MTKAGIIGSIYYSGQHLVWLLLQHKSVGITFLSSHNNTDIAFSDVYPQYVSFMQSLCIYIQTVEEKLPFIDVLFIALPHGKSFDIVEKALALGVRVIDLGTDFRLKDMHTYYQWYGLHHRCSHLLPRSIEELYQIYKDFYAKDPFVRVMHDIPQTKWVKGSNLCDIGVRIDKRTERVIIVSAIDNLIKGAAGQAVQNMNVLFDMEETEGLDWVPMAP